MKFVSIGWGAKLHLIDGAKCQAVNLTFVPTSTEDDPISSWRASFAASPGSNWLDSIYGGDCSLMPGAMSNHKPGVWYHDKFYFSSMNIEDTPDFYIMNWDGSGIYKQGGFAPGLGYRVAWRNGRGTELLSPSGAQNVTMQSCAHIVHNGVLFIIGASPFFTISPGDSWIGKEGWDVKAVSNASDGSNRRKRRKYIVFGIDKRKKKGAKDHKFISQPTEFLPNATTQEDTHACDAISYGNDIYFASYCDLIRFPGGSGTPRIVESTLDHPTSKCFELFPTSGFINHEPVFGSGLTRPDLLMLTGSGVLKQVRFNNGDPSGTSLVFDLADIVTDSESGDVNNRTGGPLVRTTSSTEEPVRSCYLKMFKENLHAFFPSATSGYHYMRCSGDPRFLANWSNETNKIPEDIRRWDGDIYGNEDVFKKYLYVMHVSKSEYGLWGHVGGQRSAGGMYMARIDQRFNFTEVYCGMSAEPSVGLLSYDNTGVSAISPSGNGPQVIASTDYALINYKLYSAYPRSCKVTIEYTIDEGMTWHTAKRFRAYNTALLLGDGTTSLAASYFGVDHTFYWDHLNDLGCNANKKAKIRIIPEIER